MTREPTMQQETRSLQSHVKKLENQLQLLRTTTCRKCGRSLPPDGDCYGCKTNHLYDQVAKMTCIIASFLLWSDQINDPDLLKRARAALKNNLQ